MKSFILLFALLVVGCTGGQIQTTDEMVSLAEKTQQVKIVAATDVSIACRTGLMQQDQCLAASQAYLAWQLLNSSKLNLLLMNCSDPVLSERVQKLISDGYPPLIFTLIQPIQ